MNNFFAELFESGLKENQEMMNLAKEVWLAKDYLFLGLGSFVIPAVLLGIFYRLIDPQPIKVWKWLLACGIVILAVYASSFIWLYQNSMYEPLINELPRAGSFTNIISFRNALFSIIPILVFSFILSRTFSINNARNPI